MGFIGDMFGGGGDDSADASIQASQTQANSQREALEYIKEREELPSYIRENALTQLGTAYSAESEAPKSQEETIKSALSSPLYGSLMSGQEAGEESILRNASATGGLRSGNAQAALYDYNVQLENKALLTSYNDEIKREMQTRDIEAQRLRGLEGLAGVPSMAPTIAQQTSAIGTTLGQGQIAAAQAQQTGSQQGFGNIMGAGQLGLDAYGSGMFSDRRLKKNIKKIREWDGWNIYSWDWNVVAEKMGLTGKTIGVMADEVYFKQPEAVIIKNSFMFIKYDMIGILSGKTIVDEVA